MGSSSTPTLLILSVAIPWSYRIIGPISRLQVNERGSVLLSALPAPAVNEGERYQRWGGGKNDTVCE